MVSKHKCVPGAKKVVIAIVVAAMVVVALAEAALVVATHQAPFCKRVSSHTQISICIDAHMLKSFNANTQRFALLFINVTYLFCMCFVMLFALYTLL